jgi:hypothetical protein
MVQFKTNMSLPDLGLSPQETAALEAWIKLHLEAGRDVRIDVSDGVLTFVLFDLNGSVLAKHRIDHFKSPPSRS